LFFGSFLSATIVPFSSEAILAGMLVAGADAFLCLVLASIGNWLGGMTGYFLGLAGNAEKIYKFLKVEEQRIWRWENAVGRWGVWLALLCWLPFVGDFVAVALGFFKINKGMVAIFMFVGKFLRYVFVIFVYDLIF